MKVKNVINKTFITVAFFHFTTLFTFSLYYYSTHFTTRLPFCLSFFRTVSPSQFLPTLLHLSPSAAS